ncbi:MAG: CHAT domain-containing protein [Desulfobacteraceae bacterium]|nr:MAG: CHAT domain-containing protein [Desulfobacteraceae bacterium]
MLQAEQKTLLDRIEQLNPDLGSLLRVNPLNCKEVQTLLDENTVILAYYTGSEWTGVFVVSKGNIMGLHLDIPRKPLVEKVKEFRKETEEGLSVKALMSKEYEKPLTALYGLLIKPVEKELEGKKHVVVIPHGMLHYLPFQALRSPEGKYLIESYTVSYLPSASVLKYAREKNRGNRATSLPWPTRRRIFHPCLLRNWKPARCLPSLREKRCCSVMEPQRPSSRARGRDTTCCSFPPTGR